MEKIAATLLSVSNAIKQYKMSHPKQENKYNIFQVLQIDQREVLMCRVLADLLNPSGSHGLGRAFLDKFIQMFLSDRYQELVNKQISVHKEYPITKDRRIDIALHGKNVFIPIEVKINAGDQPNQCYDYYIYAIQRDFKSKVVYVTKTGYFPSLYSVTSEDKKMKLSDNQIKCLSFNTDIIKWLGEITDMSSNEDLKTVLHQYSDAIENYCNERLQYEDECVAEVLTQTEDSFRSALKIVDAMNDAKATIMKKLFDDIETEMQPLAIKYNLKREDVFHWYEYTDQATGDFYRSSESTYPGINYVVTDAAFTSGIELWFRIEIDSRLFAMFSVFDVNARNEDGEKGNQKDDVYQCQKLQKELRKYLNYDEVETMSWIVTWRYLPTGSSSKTVSIEQVPDFKKMNEAAIKLADANYRRQFVKSLIPVIEQEFLKKLKQ